MSVDHAAAFKDIDRASILGAALAAILTLTVNDDAWNWLGLFCGTALSAVVLYFFRVPADTRRGTRLLSAEWGQLFAHAAVAALCIGLAFAWPWQWILQEWTPEGRACDAAGVVAEATARAGLDPAALQAAAADPRIGEVGGGGPEELQQLVVREAGDAARGACAGRAATEWLWAPILVFGVVTFLRTNGKSRRRGARPDAD